MWVDKQLLHTLHGGSTISVRNTNRAKSRSCLAFVSVDQSFWNFEKNTEVVLPYSVQHFTVIMKPRHYLWANEISRGLGLRCVSGGYHILHYLRVHLLSLCRASYIIQCRLVSGNQWLKIQLYNGCLRIFPSDEYAPTNHLNQWRPSATTTAYFIDRNSIPKVISFMECDRHHNYNTLINPRDCLVFIVNRHAAPR